MPPSRLIVRVLPCRRSIRDHMIIQVDKKSATFPCAQLTCAFGQESELAVLRQVAGFGPTSLYMIIRVGSAFSLL